MRFVKSPKENPEKTTRVYTSVESLTLRPAINKAEGSRGSRTGCCSTLLFLCCLGGQEAAQPSPPPPPTPTGLDLAGVTGANYTKESEAGQT